ncbi:MAG TPA: peptidoglycan-binding protein, partial [Candidatus Binatia bacterium]|nr:peptidoglycan-binding protein [Candidatus Binatia bacterium]
YLELAVDADHSGAPDLWSSMPDVFASTANHLVHGGWIPGTPWGFEVKLPQGFPYQEAELDNFLGIEHWQQLGVKLLDGRPLPLEPGPTAILVLAGQHGPTFLVTQNFKAILGYNYSTSYALSVAYLGQRILGGQGVVAPWPTTEPQLNLDEREEIQTRLAARGYDVGTPDGILGLKTRKAIRRFQATIGWPQDGFANKALLDALRQAPAV